MNSSIQNKYQIPTNSILVVEDEDNLLEALKYNLQYEGYQVSTANNGSDGLEIARASHPDLVILDVMLPGLDGLDVCRLLRRESDAMILMLTAKGEEVDRVVGLELGADDYVTKPFSMRELMARVRALLRRRDSAVHSQPNNHLKSGSLEVDLGAHQASLNGIELKLTPREFELLAHFLKNRGRAFTRDQLLEQLWGQGYIGDTRTVDVHIRWLREKIENNSATPARIITIRGVGYRFEG
jgi:DNA-binding response OmpR family regulator